MKRPFVFLLLLAMSLGFTSCEDVIEVDPPTEEPRLIIDALIRVDNTEQFTEARVFITLTSSFFESPTPVSVDQITMLNVDNPGSSGPDSGVLNEVAPGVYSKFFTTAEISQDRWLLQVNYQGDIYVAFAEFVPSVPIDGVEQGDGSIFDEDDTEVIVTFTDEEQRNDFYLFDFDFGNFLATEDEFYQGQTFQFSYFYDEELEVGEQAEISILGIDQEFFNYMTTLIEQSEGDFGPFETPVVTVRGNFINATDIDNDGTFNNVGDPNNFALGYFAIAEEYKTTFVVE
ncbi:DUF4249 family protein [Aureisphaera galaxeae]|uniref:DUF4249 family protein n=1 Tax=Aureisphaera galaxeae TaxID=1538023 RepID=UPI002350DF0F|nr:DUF4249 family protein [Aureisphaera galaxeae]MDC8005014.1 DUF4249 family protein [Aureisphaera galaxeae]